MHGGQNWRAKRFNNRDQGFRIAVKQIQSKFYGEIINFYKYMYGLFSSFHNCCLIFRRSHHLRPIVE